MILASFCNPSLAPADNLRLYSFNSTYYGKDYRAGAALLRARRPYIVKNALTGFGLFVFSIGVCTYPSVSKSLSPDLVPTIPTPDIMPPIHPERRIPKDPSIHATPTRRPLQDQPLTDVPFTKTDAYTIGAVGQEEFSDVKVPDAPVQKLPAQK